MNQVLEAREEVYDCVRADEETRQSFFWVWWGRREVLALLGLEAEREKIKWVWVVGNLFEAPSISPNESYVLNFLFRTNPSIIAYF